MPEFVVIKMPDFFNQALLLFIPFVFIRQLLYICIPFPDVFTPQAV